MKLLATIAAVIAVCAANVLQTAPGDNSHYKEGDRWIWIPDGKGVPHLTDLHEPVDLTLLNKNADNNRYWLYTRRNPRTPDHLEFGNQNSVLNSFFDPNLPVVVVAHGWNGDGGSTLNGLITETYLAHDNVNVIILDWGQHANGLYLVASALTPGIGVGLGEFLKFINLLGVPFWNMHLIGFSLGAHLVGVAGRTVGGQIGRITGLDPAGPGWGSINSNTLRYTDAIYVEGMHTDSGTLGLGLPVGHVDFYPNGGKSMPGCLLNTCSHSKSWEYFAATVQFNHLWGRQCSNVAEATLGYCAGATYPMGNGYVNKRGYGIYQVVTGSSWPF